MEQSQNIEKDVNNFVCIIGSRGFKRYYELINGKKKIIKKSKLENLGINIPEIKIQESSSVICTRRSTLKGKWKEYESYIVLNEIISGSCSIFDYNEVIENISGEKYPNSLYDIQIKSKYMEKFTDIQNKLKRNILIVCSKTFVTDIQSLKIQIESLERQINNLIVYITIKNNKYKLPSPLIYGIIKTKYSENKLNGNTNFIHNCSIYYNNLLPNDISNSECKFNKNELNILKPRNCNEMIIVDGLPCSGKKTIMRHFFPNYTIDKLSNHCVCIYNRVMIDNAKKLNLRIIKFNISEDLKKLIRLIHLIKTNVPFNLKIERRYKKNYQKKTNSNIETQIINFKPIKDTNLFRMKA